MSRTGQAHSAETCSLPPPGTFELITSALGPLGRWYLRHRTMHHLRALDDRMLKDIGLDRSQIEQVARHGRLST